jgi:hypothetical protein
VVSALLTLALTLGGAAPPSDALEPQTRASRVALAIVSDPRNRPLLHVSGDDFVIQEDGAAREVLSVRPADYPIILLLDTDWACRHSNAVYPQGELERWPNHRPRLSRVQPLRPFSLPRGLMQEWSAFRPSTRGQ